MEAIKVGRRTWRITSSDGHRYAVRPIVADRIPVFRRLASLALPVLPPITYVGYDSGGTASVIESWVHGSPLSVVIPHLASTSGIALNLCRLLAGSLQILHERARIIHGDFKPSNVVLELAGPRCVLVDLEFASVPGRNGWAESGGMTPRYAAPEQLEGRMTWATDIRALGLTLAEILVGHHPFEDSLRHMRDLDATARYVATHQWQPSSHSPVLQLVARMTAVDPSLRPSWSTIQNVLAY